MKKKARAIQGKPAFDDDYDAASAAEGKPQFDLSSVNKATGMMKEVFKSDKSQSEDDPILKNIEKYAKYIPLVTEFIKGFAAAAKDFQGQNLQGGTQNDNKPKAPAGWLEMGAMDKLKYKYTRPDWYNAGLAYDEYVQTGQMNPQINTSYVDNTYDDAAARRREQMAQRQRIASGDDGSNPKSLRELSHKYPEAPLASDAPPQNYEQPKETENQKPVQSTDGNKPQDTGSSEEKKDEVQVEESEIVKELQADNAKYIQMGVAYLNGLPMEKFKEHIKNIDGLVAKAKPFVPLIPIQVKGMLQVTPAKEIEEIVKVQCPEKYEWLKKNKKIPKLIELFEKLKAEIFK